jgi:thymidine phosphorylase
VSTVDALGMGQAAWRLGAGRARKEHPVSAGAGVLLHKRPGDPVAVGDVLYELRTDDVSRLAAARDEAAAALTVAAGRPDTAALILERIV